MQKSSCLSLFSSPSRQHHEHSDSPTLRSVVHTHCHCPDEQVNYRHSLVWLPCQTLGSPVPEILRCVHHAAARAHKTHTCHQACRRRPHRASLWEEEKHQDKDTECAQGARHSSSRQELCEVRSRTVSVSQVRKRDPLKVAKLNQGSYFQVHCPFFTTPGCGKVS